MHASTNLITVGHTAVTSTAQATAKLTTATNPCPNGATATNGKVDFGSKTGQDFMCVLHHNGPQSQTASDIGYWIGIHPYVTVPVLAIVVLLVYFSVRAVRRGRRPEPMSEAGMQNLAGAYLAGQTPDARGAYYYDV